ncbi:hypothetical protein IAT40_007864 [Kwoniella sp. CBS 6097]
MAGSFANEQGNMTEAQITEAGAKAFVEMHHNMNLGAMMLGFIVDSMLCGVMVAQLAHYFRYSTDDRALVKSIVAISALFSVGGTCFILFLMGHFFVDGFGTYIRFLQINYSPWMAFIGIVPSAAVQTFFANRAYNLTGKSKILAGTLAILITVSLSGAIGTIPAFAKLGAASESNNVEVFMFLWLLGGSAADVLITGFIMRALLSSRSEFHETNKTIKKLIQLVVETQLPPTLLVLGFLIVYRVSVDSYLSFFFEWIGPKAYVCGMLASLNSRHALRRTIGSENTTSKVSDMPQHEWKGSSYQLTERPPVVHVLTETYVHDDNANSVLPGSSAPSTSASATLPTSRKGLAQVPYTAQDFEYPLTTRGGGGGFPGHDSGHGESGSERGLGVGIELDDDPIGLGDKVEFDNGRGQGRDGYIP